MKLSKTIDQTRICKKSYDDPLGYFCMGFFFTCPNGQVTKNFTCPTDISTCPGHSDKRYCRGLTYVFTSHIITKMIPWPGWLNELGSWIT